MDDYLSDRDVAVIMDDYLSDRDGSEYMDNFSSDDDDDGGSESIGMQPDSDAFDESESEWSGDSFYSSKCSDIEGTVDAGMYGAIVERLKLEEEKDDKNNDRQETLEGRAQVDEMWLGLPDEIMVSILARLSFSSFCRFRAVCKKWRALQWNALAVNPNAARTMATNSQEVPFCVVEIGPNQFASYNPSAHCWHHLPASFVTSLEKSANNCKDNRVLAASGGLLVLDSPQQELYVVNPINKSSRPLPPVLDPLNEPFHGLPPDETSICEVHLHLDELHSSFMVFKYGKLNLHEDYLGWGGHWIQIYNPKTNSWKNCGNCSFLSMSRILSTVEFEGDICCLYTYNIGHCRTCVFQGEDPTDVYAQVNVNIAPVISVRDNFFTSRDVPPPPRKLRGGQLFVKDRYLMLGGVVACNLRGARYYSARIWKLNHYDIDYTPGEWYPSRGEWDEVACMPVELMEELSCILEEPHVFVHGDYMWVCTDVPPSVGMNFGMRCGVMCHMPSNLWWKLPKYNVKKNSYPAQRSKSEDGESQQSSSSGEDSSQDHFWDLQKWYNQRTRQSFLFNPRMDLLV